MALSRHFNVKTDDLTILLQVEDEEIRSDDTTAKIQLSKDENEVKKGWNAVLKSQADTFITMSVSSPADCIVAKWTIQVKTATKTEAGIESSDYTLPLPIYILFNPWCENDNVYMADANHREEYVENDDGVIFVGTSDDIKRKGWSYAQYDKDILDCAVYLMKNIGMIKGRARGDPIATTRALSAAVNNDIRGEISEDHGILVGRWNAPYTDGTLPMDWFGSSKIIQQYYGTKQPVRYAQCWVFAGTLTTVLRALGIPCRPVSCFTSAHDNNGDLIILKDEESIWNFHVWNEAWMTRPDLGTEYSGWQIVDATPQEMSSGKFQCGPASLAAIYNGDMDLPYDNKFVFAEINADWIQIGPDKKVQLVNTTSIGQKISTKAIGSYEREDLTNCYKSPEGSIRERETFLKALVKSESEKYREYYQIEDLNKDVKFEIQPFGDVMIGQGFEVVLNIKNQSTTSSHHVTGRLDLSTETYTGRFASSVKRQAFDVHLKPEQKTKVSVMVTFEDYYEKLVEQNYFRVQCEANIAEIHFDYYMSEPFKFRVRNPKVNIEFDGSETLTLELTNPLPIALNNGKFRVHIASQIEEEIKLNQKIPPGQAAQATMKVPHLSPGRYIVRAQFSSDELHYPEGYTTLIL
ncbi:annulin-like [Aricia agestis]|uniref:annulin-like n=1 Tax=Aricia agestis TaxID=91739 RepID=UPI001C20BDCE|nr:annulin-like [Aricia agestis]